MNVKTTLIGGPLDGLEVEVREGEDLILQQTREGPVVPNKPVWIAVYSFDKEKMRFIFEKTVTGYPVDHERAVQEGWIEE